MIGYATDFSWLPVEFRTLVQTPFEDREFLMPLNALLIVFLYLRFFFIFITQLWKPLNGLLGWLVLPLGQSSLLTFIMHLVAIPILWATPGVSEELPLSVATLWNLYYLGIIYFSVRLYGWWRNSVLESTTSGRKIASHLPIIFTSLTLILFLGAGAVNAEPNWEWEDEHYYEEYEEFEEWDD